MFLVRTRIYNTPFEKQIGRKKYFYGLAGKKLCFKEMLAAKYDLYIKTIPSRSL